MRLINACRCGDLLCACVCLCVDLCVCLCAWLYICVVVTVCVTSACAFLRVQGEMMVFLQTLTRAVYRVGITRRIPAQREVYSLARAMFLAADSNRNGKLSCDEFCAWAKHHVASQRLLTSFQRERELDGADADLAVSVPDDGEAADAADGPQRNLILAQLAKERQEELLEGASSPRLSTNAMYRTSMAVARMRKRLRGGADAAASAVTGKELQDLRAKLVLLEQQAVASQDVMAALQSDTKFDMSELRRLRDRFVKVAKGSKELSRKQFVAVLTGEYKTLRGTSVSNLFDAFDLDGNGSVSFQELTMGLNRITKGTVEDKIKFMFSVYDIDGDGGYVACVLAGAAWRSLMQCLLCVSASLPTSSQSLWPKMPTP